MPRQKQECPRKRNSSPTIQDTRRPCSQPDDCSAIDLRVKRRRLLTPDTAASSSDDGRSSSLGLPLGATDLAASLTPWPLTPSLVTAPTKPTCNALDKLSNLVSSVGKRQHTPAVQASRDSVIRSAPSQTTKSSAPGAAKCEQWRPTSSPGTIAMPELWWKYMKKEESAELKRISEAKQIFTCLQCTESFQSMDELVKHMGATRHFANVPKNYSWSLHYARQRMRQMKMKLKYSERMMYFCHICGDAFGAAVHKHFAEVHNMHNPVENMNFVQVIMGAGGGDDEAASVSGGDSSPPPTLSPVTGSAQATQSTQLLRKMEQLVRSATTPTAAAAAARR